MATMTRAQKKARNKQLWAQGARWHGDGLDDEAVELLQHVNGVTGAGNSDLEFHDSGFTRAGKTEPQVAPTNGNGWHGKTEATSDSPPEQPAKRNNRWRGKEERAESGAGHVSEAPARADEVRAGVTLPRSVEGRLQRAAQAEDPSDARWFAGSACMPCRCGLYGRALVLGRGGCWKCGH